MLDLINISIIVPFFNSEKHIKFFFDTLLKTAKNSMQEEKSNEPLNPTQEIYCLILHFRNTYP